MLVMLWLELPSVILDKRCSKFINKCKVVFPLRLRVALRGERNRNTIGVSISLAMQRHATQHAAVMEISLNALCKMCVNFV